MLLEFYLNATVTQALNRNSAEKARLAEDGPRDSWSPLPWSLQDFTFFPLMGQRLGQRHPAVSLSEHSSTRLMLRAILGVSSPIVVRSLCNTVSCGGGGGGSGWVGG